MAHTVQGHFCARDKRTPGAGAQHSAAGPRQARSFLHPPLSSCTELTLCCIPPVLSWLLCLLSLDGLRLVALCILTMSWHLDNNRGEQPMHLDSLRLCVRCSYKHLDDVLADGLKITVTERDKTEAECEKASGASAAQATCPRTA